MPLSRAETQSPLSLSFTIPSDHLWYDLYFTGEKTPNTYIGCTVQYNWTVIGGNQATISNFYITDLSNHHQLRYNQISNIGSGSGVFIIPFADEWIMTFEHELLLFDGSPASVTVQVMVTYTFPSSTSTSQIPFINPPMLLLLLGFIFMTYNLFKPSSKTKKEKKRD